MDTQAEVDDKDEQEREVETVEERLRVEREAVFLGSCKL
jgi:hypothetical protein